MQFPKIDEQFLNDQITAANKADAVHEFLDPRISIQDIEKIKKADELSVTLSTIEGAMGLVEKSFPRITEMIKAGWGSKELHEKLGHMIQVDTMKRAGFHNDIGFALMKIYQSHMEKCKFAPIGVPDKFKQDKW